MKAKKFMSIVGALTLTLGMVASLPARSQRLIRQFIYENGNQFAKAVFSGGGSGWWSPDSVGSYTYAN